MNIHSTIEPKSTLLCVSRLIVGDTKGNTIIGPISLELHRGEVLWLTGRNGAGKSVFLKCLAGLMPIVEGDIYLGGERLNEKLPFERIHEGLALVPDDNEVFTELSAGANLLINAPLASISSNSQAIYFLKYFHLSTEDWLMPAGKLSGGQRHLLSILAAICRRPSLLLIDEFKRGVSPEILVQLLYCMRYIASNGVGVVLVAHDLLLADPNADRTLNMNAGQPAVSVLLGK